MRMDISRQLKEVIKNIYQFHHINDIDNYIIEGESDTDEESLSSESEQDFELHINEEAEVQTSRRQMSDNGSNQEELQDNAEGGNRVRASTPIPDLDVSLGVCLQTPEKVPFLSPIKSPTKRRGKRPREVCKFTPIAIRRPRRH